MQKGVEIRVRADTTQAKREIKSLEQSVAGLESTANKVTSTFQKLALLFAGFGASKSIIKASDALTEMENRLALVVGRGGELNASLEEMYRIAERTRQPVKSVTDTFNRLGLALDGTGKSADELFVATEAIQQAAQISGASAESASAAIIQLGQGLASGQLRGEELNSVLEQMPRLARAIAKGMGIPFSELRTLAKDGKLDAEAVFGAIIQESETLDKEFRNIKATTSSLAYVLNNEFSRALGLLDKEFGFGERMRETMNLAIEALKFFNDNLGLWVSGVKIKLSLAQNDFVFFKMKIYETWQSIFSGEGFNPQAFVDAAVAPFTAAKAAIAEAWGSIASELPELDLASKIPTFESIKGKLDALKNGVISIFYEIWKRIVGNSIWTGIFDPAHMESGQTLAVGSDLTRFWEAPFASIGKLKDGIIKLFKDIGESVSKEWSNIWTNLTTATIETPAGTKVIDNTFGTKIKEANKQIKDAKAQLDELFNTLTTKEISTPIGPQVVEREYVTVIKNIRAEVVKLKEDLIGLWKDLWVQVKETPAGLKEVNSPLAQALVNIERYLASNTSDVISGLTSALNAFAELPLVKFATIAVSTTFKAAGTAITDFGLNIDEFKKNVDTWFENNKDAIGAAVSLGFASAIKFGMKKTLVGAALVSIFVVGGSEALASSEFQASAESLAYGYTDLIIKAFTSDNGGGLLRGIGDTINSVGRGINKRLFGEDFQNNAMDSLTGALIVIFAGITITGNLKSALSSLGGRLLLGILGGFLLADSLSNAMEEEMKKASADGKVSIWGAMNLGAVEGAGVGASIGLLFGPEGAIGGAIVGGIIGAIVSGIKKAWEQADFSGLYTNIKDSVYNGIVDAWDKVKSIFTIDFSKVGVYGQYGGNGVTRYGPIDNATKQASGGYISGPGSATSDSIPAMLSNGEFVVKASSVQKFGKGFMDKINAGIMPQFFADGTPPTTSLVYPYQADIDAMSREAHAFRMAGWTKDADRADADLADAISRRDAWIAARTADTSSPLGTAGLTAATDTEKGKKLKVAEDAAKSIYESFKSSFSSSFAELLKTGDIDGFFKSIINSFTSSVIDAFTQGLTDQLFGDGKALTNLFKNMFNFGGKVSEVATKGVTDGVNKAGGAGNGAGGGFLSNLFTSLGSIFSGLFKGIGTFFSGLFGGVPLNSGGVVPNFQYRASGGVINPQVAKDSVPVMLTPGEYILPSKRSAELLKASANAKQQQVFHINVTGDVSRQTRKEIIAMIPEITSGVNVTNKENNYR